MSQERFNNEKYIDWVKLKLTLHFAKEGLEPVTEKEVHAFFNSLRSGLQSPSSSFTPAGATLCHACVKADLKKQWSRQRFSCVSGVCDGWLDLLQQHHVNPTSTVEWDNVDVSCLPVSPWECAKLYLPYGSGHIKGAGDADLAAILTLYLNCRYFASILQDVTLCTQIKDVRNSLLHSGTMEVDNADMLHDVGLVKQLLSDPAFNADKSCQEAIAKIDKLVRNKLELSLNKELELQVLNRDIKYVAGRTDQVYQNMTGLTNQLGTHVTEVNKEVTGLKDKIGTHVTEVNKEVTVLKGNLGTHLIEVNKEVKGLKDQMGSHVTKVNKKVTGLKDQMGSHVTKVNKKVTGLKDQMGTHVTEVNKEVTGLKDKMGSHVTEVNTKVTGLKDQMGTHVTEVNKEVTGLKDKLGSHVIEVNKEVTGLKDQLRTHVTEVNTEVIGLKDKLGSHVTEVNKEVTGMKDQVGKHKVEVNNEVASMKDKIEASFKDINQLQRFASLLCSFIKACQIEKVDMGQLATTLRTLSDLKAETERQCQTLAELQDTVGHHGATLEKHEQSIDQVKQEQLSQKRKLHRFEFDIQAKKKRGDHHQETVNISSLQQYLITVYNNDCKWENSTTADEDKKVSISQMYVKPTMRLVRQRDDSGALVQVQQRQGDWIEGLFEMHRIQEYENEYLEEILRSLQGNNESTSLSYRQIFYTGKEQCTNIYITGDAGMGKTTFCKQLVHTWCKAVQNISEEGDSAEDLKLLKEFRVLFYVRLREAESQYHIEDMIRRNVQRDDPTEYNVPDILKTEKCLIVLDGLDEWSCPKGANLCRGLNREIPGRNAINKKCVYLTTSRNWKFDVIDVKSKDVDKHVELCGIGKNSSKEFAENVVHQLDPKFKSNRQVTDFFREVKDKNLESLTIVPVLLTQLLTLWYFFKGLGMSQVQLYCKMLDLLFEKAMKHLPETASTVTKSTQTDVELPECFTEADNCCNHKQLLLCLSKLAFSSLLNKKKEECLVFKSSRLNVCGINSSDIILCLKCGIFTQSKVLSNPTGKFKKYSFLHKKLQEFLAAVHLVTSDNLEENMRQVREYCDTLDTTLEMGQMFMFVCGMKSWVGNQLLEHLASVVSGDKRVQNYRQFVLWEPLIKDIQSCVMACVAEGASNGLIINVHLQDVWIDYDTIPDYVNHVVEKNQTRIKSVYIYTKFCTSEHVAVVLNHLQGVHTLEKLQMENLHIYSLLSINAANMLPDPGSILAAVINNNVDTLKSLCLGRVNICPDVLFAAVLVCIPSLRALQLEQYNVMKENMDEMLEELEKEHEEQEELKKKQKEQKKKQEEQKKKQEEQKKKLKKKLDEQMKKQEEQIKELKKKLEEQKKKHEEQKKRLKKEHEERKKEQEEQKMERKNKQDEQKKEQDELKKVRKNKQEEWKMEQDEQKKEQKEQKKEQKNKQEEQKKEQEERKKELVELLKNKQELNRLKKVQEERQKEQKERKKEKEELKKEEEELDRRLEELEERNKKVEEQKKEHEERKKAHEERKKEHEEQNKEHEERKKEYEEQKKEHEERKKEYEEQKKELEEQKKELEELNKEHEELKKELEEQKKEHEERKKEYEELEELKKELEELKKEQEERKKEPEERKKELEERKNKLEERKKELEERKNKLEERKKEQDERKNKLEERKKEQDERKKEQEELEERKKEQEERKKEQEALEELKKEQEKHKKEQEKLKKEQEEQENEQGELKNKQEEQNKEQEERNKEQEELLKGQEERKKELEERKKDLEEREKEKEERKKEQEERKKEQEEQNKEQEEQKKEQEELEELKKELEEWKKERGEHNKELEEWKKELDQLQEYANKKLELNSRPSSVVSVTHDQILQLLPATTHLTQLHLQLYCTDHGGACRPVVDMSAHTQLQSLKLRYVSVTNLNTVAHNVKYVRLRDVTVAHGTLRPFIEALAQTSNKVKVELSDVTVTEDSANHVDLVTYLRGSDKFIVTSCDIMPDKAWSRVYFYKK